MKVIIKDGKDSKDQLSVRKKPMVKISTFFCWIALGI
jgi:hypothetical protein